MKTFRIWKQTAEDIWEDMYRAARTSALIDRQWQEQLASYDWDELPIRCQQDLENLLLR